jgi:hypothetical protein
MTRFALVLAALALSGSAGAFVLLAPTRTWQITPVAIEINPNKNHATITDGDYGHAAVAAALNDAVSGWNQVASIETTANAGGRFAIGDGTPTITFDDPRNICVQGCLAVTLTGFYTTQGQVTYIDDADIFVSKKAGIKFTSETEDPTTATCSPAEFYIEGVMMHEVGHAIGLDHSAVGSATMNAFATPCDQGGADIDPDDAAGADVLY